MRPLHRAFEPVRSLVGGRGRKVALSLVDQGVVSGTRFVTTVALGRMCGADELGTYSLAFGAILFLVGIEEALVSIPFTVHSQSASQAERRRAVGTAILQVLLFAVLAQAVMAALLTVSRLRGGTEGVLSGSSPWMRLMWAMACVVPTTLLSELARRVALAELRVSLALAIDVTACGVQLLLLLALGTTGTLTGVTALAAMAVGGLGGFSLWAVRSARAGEGSDMDLRAAWEGSGRSLWSCVLHNWSFGRWVLAGNMAQVFNAYAMHWMLVWMMGTASTGTFSACLSLVMLMNPLILGVSNLLVPGAARAYQQGGARRVRRIILPALLVVGSLAGAFCVVVTLFGAELLRGFYGPEFARHATTLSVLALGTLAGVCSLVANDGLWALNRPRTNFSTSLLGMVVMVAAGFSLIPHWGVLGAAYSLLMGRMATAVSRLLLFLHAARGTRDASPREARRLDAEPTMRSAAVPRSSRPSDAPEAGAASSGADVPELESAEAVLCGTAGPAVEGAP
jgi:O-antigen/teichoic acid export membrane protein